MVKPTARGAAGPLVALVIALAVLAVPYLRHGDEIRQFGRFQLPAFDPYVYVAMAEQPTFFTVAPWGYRVITPWTVHALGARNVVQGYRIEMVAGLALAGVLLFLFLRAAGHATVPCWAAVAAFGLSLPVAECVQSVFVAEPLSVCLEIGFLLGVETGASAPALCLLLTLMAASKEIWVLLLPLVYLAARGTWLRRAVTTAAAGLPPLVVALALRFWWAPQVTAPRPRMGPAEVATALRAFLTAWPETWPGLVLYGVTPLALLGLAHPGGRAFARRYGLLAAALTALALTAWLYVPSRTVQPFYGENTARLMIYVLPLLLPMALFAVELARRAGSGRAGPALSPAPPPAAAVAARPTRSLRPVLASVAVAACMILPFAALDRYRRVPLHDRRDGPLVLAVCRESLRTARRLEAGRSVTFDLEAREDSESGDPRFMTVVRWYLREGWEEGSDHGIGPARMVAPDASLLLPCLRSRNVAVSLLLEAPAGARVDVLANGRPVGTWAPDRAIVVPKEILFRGDNLLTLRSAGGEIRLRGLSYAGL